MRVGPILLLTLTCAPATVCADPIQESLHSLYDLDFAGANRTLEAYIKANPSDPLGYAVRASSLLFYEMHRLKILESEFFSDDKKIGGDEKLDPDPATKQRLLDAIETAQRLATMRLQKDPGDTTALFSFSITEGVRTDYTAFVEKKQLRSLSSAKKAHNYALELSKRDPNFTDALLTKGIHEYLVGSLPFFIKWFVKFDETQGSKELAVVNLEKVAQKGRYFGPFARILLAIVHLREKRPEKAREELRWLTREFPHNPLFRNELTKLNKKLGG
ncbi:MAG: hypothetical protein R2729_14280 [Bryobacteraceae bacterium]